MRANRAGRSSAPSARYRERVLANSRWIDVGWALFTNLFLLAGVIAWGWPPGNVFLLFWIENVILGVITVVRIVTAQGPDPQSTSPAWATALFFTFHYGIFALVHGVFVGVIAFGVGLSVTWWTLGVPTLLIALRYVFDLTTVWFLGGQRRSVTSGQAFAWPYPRLFVLHIATILGFAFVMPFGDRNSVAGWILAPVQQILAAAGVTLSRGAALVALLMVLKTFADVTLILNRGKPTRWRLNLGFN